MSVTLLFSFEKEQRRSLMLFACGPCQSPIVCNDVVKNKETNAFLPNLKGQHRTWVATYYRGARESRDTGTVH